MFEKELHELTTKYDFSEKQGEAIRTFCKKIKNHTLPPEIQSSIYSDQVDLLDIDPVPGLLPSTETPYELEKTETHTWPMDPENTLVGEYPDEETVFEIGRYEDLGAIAAGGMGEVRKVRDQELNRTLAMKIIHRKYIQNSNYVVRFVEEAQVISQLQHPNIIPVYELNTLEDGRLYYTMKEVRGDTLSAVIKKVHAATEKGGGKAEGWSLHRLIDSYHKVCTAMAYAHNRGVIHRDLKPANIMVGAFGEVLVMDWGLAKVRIRKDRLASQNRVETDRSSLGVYETQVGQVAGTPAYMPIEQAQGDPDLIDQRTDVYSLGAILYEILTGSPPYRGKSAEDIFQQLLSGPPISLHSIKEGIRIPSLSSATKPIQASLKQPISEELILICEKAMQRDKEERYQSAADLAKAIQDWLEGARRRAKALVVIEKAEEIAEKNTQLYQDAQHCRKMAADFLEMEGDASLSAWEKWEESQKILQQAERGEKDKIQQYQGALIYEPTLVEAHQKLAQYHYELMVEAKGQGERKKEVLAAQQLQAHLQHIPERERSSFKEVGLRLHDPIEGLRLRRGSFVGRKKEIESILEHFASGTSLISLVGTAGVGKTGLAIELASLLKKNSSVVFCDLTEATEILEVIRLIALTMGLQLSPRDPLPDLINQLVQIGKTVLVLDNVEQTLAAVRELHVRHFSQISSLQILITSRAKLGFKGEKIVSISPLHPLEALELFIQRGQQSNPEFEVGASNWGEIIRLLPRLDHLPLAIELAAARLRSLSVQEIAKRIHERFSLLRGRIRDKKPKALQAALDWSWELLSDWSKATLCQVSVFSGGFDLKAAEQVVDLSDWDGAPGILDVLEALCDDSLLLHDRSSDGSLRYGLLESIRFYAREKLSKRGKSMEHVTRRHASYYAGLGQQMLLSQTKETTRLWSTLIRERDNLVAGVRNGHQEAADICCLSAIKVLELRGPMSLGVALAEERLQQDDLGTVFRIRLMVQKSHCLRLMGKLDEARESCVAALRMAKESTAGKDHDRLAVAHGLFELGKIEIAQSNYLKAQQHLEKALQRYKKKRHLIGEAQSQTALGDIQRYQGKAIQAIQRYRSSLVISQEIGDAFQEAITLSGIGHAYREQALYREAQVYLEQAISIQEDLGDRVSEANSLAALGSVFQNRNQNDKAIACYEQAIRLHRKVGDRNAEGVALGKLGIVFRNQGHFQKAISSYERAISIHQEVGERRNEGIYLGNLGNIYFEQGNFQQAISCFQEAISIHREIGDRRNEGVFLGVLGKVYSNQGFIEKALEQYLLALEIHRKINNRKFEAGTLGNMGIAYQEQEDYAQALKCYQQAIEIHDLVGDKRNAAICRGNIGDMHMSLGRFSEAKSIFEEVVLIGEQTSPLIADVFRGSLALLLAKQGDLKQAMSIMEKIRDPIPVILEQGKFLCKKGQIQYLSIDIEGARQSLYQAEKIAKELNVGSKSELSKGITGLRKLFYEEG